jgi:glycosyltransferase involved in cell wall biosynthesis
MEPLVSVWMVTYNHEKYIAQALDSVLMQKTKFSFEIVIGEDFSTDNNRAILEDYVRKYPEIIFPIYQETNKGSLRNAYEFTLPKCRGKFVACLEGDDYWIDPFKLQKQVDFMNKNTEYGMVHTRYQRLNCSTGEIMGTFTDISIPEGDIYEEFLTKSIIGTATVMFRRKLVGEFCDLFGSLQASWPMGDRPLWLFIASKTKVGFINDYTAVYRRNNSSVTSFSSVYDQIEFFKKSYEVRFYFTDHVRSVTDEVKNKMYRDYFSELLKYYYSVCDFPNSSKVFRELKNKYGFDYRDYLRFIGSRNSTFSFLAATVIKVLNAIRRLLKN